MPYLLSEPTKAPAPAPAPGANCHPGKRIEEEQADQSAPKSSPASAGCRPKGREFDRLLDIGPTGSSRSTTACVGRPSRTWSILKAS